MTVLLNDESVDIKNSFENFIVEDKDRAMSLFIMNFANSSKIIQIRKKDDDIKLFSFKDKLSLNNFDFDDWEKSELIFETK